MSSRPIAVLATVAASLVAATVAFAHTEVEQRSPRAGATLSTGPRSVSISFSRQLRPGATLTVKRGSRIVLRGRKDPRNVKRVRATGSRRLGRGVYRVSWRAAGPDGHVQRGSWAFRVR